MDRRDFLKLFALSAAEIYIPKTTYFDFGKNITSLTLPISIEDFASVNSLWVQSDGKGGWIVPKEFEGSIKSVLKLNDELIPIFKGTYCLLGNRNQK